MLQTPQPTNSEAPEGPASRSPPQPPVPDDITHPASIERLIGLAKDSPPDSVLGIVWRHAFEEGKGIGYSEGTKLVDGLDINELTRIGVERGIERGIEIGRDREKRAWGAAGHSNICITVARPPRGVAVQTEDHPPRSITTSAVQVEMPKPLPTTPVLPHTTDSTVQTVPFRTQDASSQTTSPPSPIPDSMHTTLPSPIPLNWADDAASVPTQILHSPRPPRDLSGLCSSKSNPFSSLQRRSKNRTRRTYQFHRRHSLFNSDFSRSPHHTTFNPSQAYHHLSFPFQVQPTSYLNWDSDPRLSDLSRSLKALGWVRAH
jgi:hypothetical protein